MDIGYVDILTGGNLSSIYVANMDLINWSVRSSSRRGGDGVKVGVVILASFEFYFSRVNENLLQHPSNYISIIAHYNINNTYFKNQYAHHFK